MRHKMHQLTVSCCARPRFSLLGCGGFQWWSSAARSRLVGRELLLAFHPGDDDENLFIGKTITEITFLYVRADPDIDLSHPPWSFRCILLAYFKTGLFLWTLWASRTSRWKHVRWPLLLITAILESKLSRISIWPIEQKHGWKY